MKRSQPLIWIAALLLALSIGAQTPAQVARAQESLGETAVQTFSIQYRSAEDMKAIVSAYCSRNASVTADARNNILIVRDVRANLEAVKQILQAVDAPSTLAGLQVALQVIEASTEEAIDNPTDVAADSLSLLQSAFKFKHYSLLSEMTLNGTVNETVSLATVDHQVSFRPALTQSESGAEMAEMAELQKFDLQQRIGQSNVSLRSNILAELGKPIIVGRSSLNSPRKAVIVIVTATRTK